MGLESRDYVQSAFGSLINPEYKGQVSHLSAMLGVRRMLRARYHMYVGSPSWKRDEATVTSLSQKLIHPHATRNLCSRATESSFPPPTLSQS